MRRVASAPRHRFDRVCPCAHWLGHAPAKRPCPYYLTKSCSMRSLNGNRHEDNNTHPGAVRMRACRRLVGHSSRSSKGICAMPSLMQLRSCVSQSCGPLPVQRSHAPPRGLLPPPAVGGSGGSASRPGIVGHKCASPDRPSVPRSSRRGHTQPGSPSCGGRLTTGTCNGERDQRSAVTRAW